MSGSRNAQNTSDPTFFTVPRLDAEVTFLTGVGFLPAIVFFAGTAFALVEVADFVAEDLVAV